MARVPRTCLAAVAALAVLAPDAAAATPADYASSATQIAAPWPSLQRGDGSFREYVTGHDPRNRDDYGEAMLGYGLLQAGVRDGDDALIRAGLRAITYDAVRPDADEPIRMFRNMAIAAAYNLARERIGGHEEFARVRPAWEQRLRQVRVSRLTPGRPVTNKTLVEAVEVLELARSRLTSDVPGTVLNDSADATRMVERLMRTRLPGALTWAGRGDAPAARLALAGDAPDFPLAYHALTAGFMARAVDLLGGRAPRRARRRLDEMLTASWALAGPDGDLAYTGRSQEQIWALSLTAFAAESVRRADGDAGLGALADRALARIGREHRGGPAVFAITPALARDVGGGSRGVDTYVSAVQYSGLGLVGLNWAQEAAAPGLPVGELAADRPGSAVLGAGSARFATVRAGDLWFAVRQAPGVAGDLRSDFGLVALKQRAADGTWRDVLPIRPVSRTSPDSAGPLLIEDDPATPEGRALRVAADGSVTVTGGFRRGDGRWARRGVRFVFRVVSCGVRLEWFAEAGDRYEYSVFAAAADGRYSSGTDPLLARARLRLVQRRSGPQTVTTCAPDAP